MVVVVGVDCLPLVVDIEVGWLWFTVDDKVDDGESICLLLSQSRWDEKAVVDDEDAEDAAEGDEDEKEVEDVADEFDEVDDVDDVVLLLLLILLLLLLL